MLLSQAVKLIEATEDLKTWRAEIIVEAARMPNGPLEVLDLVSFLHIDTKTTESSFSQATESSFPPFASLRFSEKEYKGTKDSKKIQEYIRGSAHRSGTILKVGRVNPPRG